MNREQRYIVFKIADVNNAMSYEEQQTLQVLADTVERYRARAGKHQMECVVVECDWPEYEAVWKMIADRVDGITTESAEPDARLLDAAYQMCLKINARESLERMLKDQFVELQEAIAAAGQAKPAPELTAKSLLTAADADFQGKAAFVYVDKLQAAIDRELRGEGE